MLYPIVCAVWFGVSLSSFIISFFGLRRQPCRNWPPPPVLWVARWVVHCQPVGSGAAALKYLAPYIFRVALSNSRITRLENDQVTFRFKASDTGQTKDCTLPAEQFISRFLQHVLPRGFMKVRYYGLFSPAQRRLLNQARSLLGVTDPPPRLNKPQLAEIPIPHRSRRCPTCGQLMRLQETIKPRSRQPP